MPNSEVPVHSAAPHACDLAAAEGGEMPSYPNARYSRPLVLVPAQTPRGLRPALNESISSRTGRYAVSAWCILVFVVLGPFIGVFAMPAITQLLASIALIASEHAIPYHVVFGVRNIGFALFGITFFGLVPALATGIAFVLLSRKKRETSRVFFKTVLFGFGSSAAYWVLLTIAMNDIAQSFGPGTISFGLTGAVAAAVCQAIILYHRVEQARLRRTQ